MHSKTIQKDFIKHAIKITNPHTTFEDFIQHKTFIHPKTRNKVLFHSLPLYYQQFIKTRYEHDRLIALDNLINRTDTQKTLNFYPGAHHSPQLKHVLGYL